MLLLHSYQRSEIIRYLLKNPHDWHHLHPFCNCWERLERFPFTKNVTSHWSNSPKLQDFSKNTAFPARPYCHLYDWNLNLPAFSASTTLNILGLCGGLIPQYNGGNVSVEKYIKNLLYVVKNCRFIQLNVHKNSTSIWTNVSPHVAFSINLVDSPFS